MFIPPTLKEKGGDTGIVWFNATDIPGQLVIRRSFWRLACHQ